MTLVASREGKQVKVGITYGPVQASVTEEPGHARSFHGQLGALLDEVEGKPKECDNCAEAGEPGFVKTAEQRAREGHARFAASVEASGGSKQPQFDEQPHDIRQHWVAAFTQ